MKAHLVARWYAAYAVSALAVCLWIAAPVALTPLLTGCASVEEGQSSLVVNAERTVKNAWDLIDGFLIFERDNRTQLWHVDQGIKQAADRIRVEAPDAFTAANNAIRAYKRNRTPENKASLQTVLAVVNQLLADAATASAKSVRALK